MEPNGQDVGQRIRNAIKSKLVDIGCYVDDELPDYVMVMIANKKTKEQMKADLDLFLGDYCSSFCDWLHQVLDHLQRYAREGKHKLEFFDPKHGSKDRTTEDGMSLHPDADEQKEFEDVLGGHQESSSSSKSTKTSTKSPLVKMEERTKKRLKDRVDEIAKEVKKREDDTKDHSRKRIEIDETAKKETHKPSGKRTRERTPEVKRREHRRKDSDESRSPMKRTNSKESKASDSRKTAPRSSISAASSVSSRTQRRKSESDEEDAEYDPAKPSLRSVATVAPKKRLIVDKKSLEKNKILNKALLDATRSTAINTNPDVSSRHHRSKRSIQERLGSYVTEAIAQKVASHCVDIPPSLEDEVYEPSPSKSMKHDDLRSTLKRESQPIVKEGPELPPARRKIVVTNKKSVQLSKVTENVEPEIKESISPPKDENVVVRNGMIVKPSPLLEACGLNKTVSAKRPIESPEEPSTTENDNLKKAKSDISSKIPLKSLDDLAPKRPVEVVRRKCRFDPKCTNIMCPYAHPGQPCESFPRCGLSAATCNYRHPPCYYDKNCGNRSCLFTHKTDGMPAPEQVRPAQCKFFPNCTSTACPFYHPPIPCKFGLRCQSLVCPYVHPEKSTVAKLKWVAS